MPHHLPLLARAELPSFGFAPRRTARGAIALSDAGTGEAALELASVLACALHDAGRQVDVALLAYGALPHVGPARAAALARGAGVLTCHAIDPARTPAALPAPHDSRALHVLVGLPALGSFDAALSIWIEAASAPRSRAVPLAGLRSRAELVLESERPALGVALARALIERGFLPRG